MLSTETTPPHHYWLGGTLGAVTLTSVSSAVMWFVEKRMPTVKTVGRDLILGAILFFLLLQLLPESTLSLLTAVIAFVATKSELVDGASNIIVAVTEPIPMEDMELRVGVPTF